MTLMSLNGFHGHHLGIVRKTRNKGNLIGNGTKTFSLEWIGSTVSHVRFERGQ